jgi:hypothetical protein
MVLITLFFHVSFSFLLYLRLLTLSSLCTGVNVQFIFGAVVESKKTLINLPGSTAAILTPSSTRLIVPPNPVCAQKIRYKGTAANPKPNTKIPLPTTFFKERKFLAFKSAAEELSELVEKERRPKKEDEEEEDDEEEDDDEKKRKFVYCFVFAVP